jgi:4-alpha-glucanotransferase
MRTAGILMHISSLPSPYGIGTLGKECYEFIDFLKKAGQTYWQILPIGPTGFGDSPYQTYSAFAGNPLLIDIPTLIAEGLVEANDMDATLLNQKKFFDYAHLFHFKKLLLDKAYSVFVKKGDTARFAAFDEFCEKNAFWLDDYAIYMTIKEHQNLSMWTMWEDDLRLHDEDAVKQFAYENGEEISSWKFMQFKFFEQYARVKKYANKKGIRIFGDMPIYVSMDSSDIWAHPEMFMLDSDRRPTKVAGCPPDAFAAGWQLWGNPLYDWDYMEKDDYSWWVQRLRYSSQLFDLTRIDHFRGFESFYAIPADRKDAVIGEWVKGPGMALFARIKNELGNIPLVAEDLGFLDDDVRRMLASTGYPGMKVMEFGFGGDDSEHLPHNIPKKSVCYIGTHDNQTAVGWYLSAEPATKKRIRRYLGLGKLASAEKVCDALIRAAYMSPADTCIIQMQDVLQLGDEARMNVPSTIGNGNWCWRMKHDQLDAGLAKKLKKLCKIYFR